MGKSWGTERPVSLTALSPVVSKTTPSCPLESHCLLLAKSEGLALGPHSPHPFQKKKPFLWPPRYSMMLTVLWRFQQWFLQRQVFSFCLRFAKHRHRLRGGPGLRVGLHKHSPLKCSFFSCLCRMRERLWSLIWSSSDLVFLPAPSYHLTWSMSSAKHSLSSQWALFLDPPVLQSNMGWAHIIQK